MEYQKIINLLDDTTNQPSNIKTWNLVEMTAVLPERMAK